MKIIKILSISLFITILSITLIFTADADKTKTYDDWEKTETELSVNKSSRRSGDLDGDGQITSNDARLCLRYSVGLENPDERELNAADIFFNKKTDSSNARLILRKSINLETLPSPVYKIKTSDKFVLGPFANAGSGLYQWKCNIKNNTSDINANTDYYYCPDFNQLGASVYSVYTFSVNKAGIYDISLTLENIVSHEAADKYEFKIAAEE